MIPVEHALRHSTCVWAGRGTPHSGHLPTHAGTLPGLAPWGRYDTCVGLPSALGRQAVATKHEERYTAACSGPRRRLDFKCEAALAANRPLRGRRR